MKFSLEDYGCERLNPASMGIAIKQYTDDMQTFSKIANFYRNIEKGTQNFVKESEITSLKNEMGVDDDFLRKLFIAKENYETKQLLDAKKRKEEIEDGIKSFSK